METEDFRIRTVEQAGYEAVRAWKGLRKAGPDQWFKELAMAMVRLEIALDTPRSVIDAQERTGARQAEQPAHTEGHRRPLRGTYPN